MKKVILTLALSVSFILPSFAQRNYLQELINLVEQGKCFEAREYRSQYADKLPLSDKTFDIFYKAHMALFFNKSDSAAIYLKDLIDNHTLKIGPGIGPYYAKLLTIYNNKQRFKEGMMLCDKYMDHLRRNPFDQDQGFIHKEMSSTENTKKAFKYRDVNEPRIGIERDDSGKDKSIRINDSEYIRFNTKYNGVSVETWFDTGASTYFMITRSLADKIGTKLVDKNQDSVQIVNGIPTRARFEVIDQINLGGVKLYNIPVLVFNERFIPYTKDTLNAEIKSKDKEIFGDREIVMGLPAMKLIGKIGFDRRKRTISFSAQTQGEELNDSSNIFLIDNNLYLKLKINKLDYLGYLNTGSDCTLHMTSSFYEKTKMLTETASIAQKKPLDQHAITGDSFNNVHLDVKLINHKNGDVLVSDRKTTINVFDGIVGVNLFKRLGSKISFDFDNMRLKVSD